MTSLGAMRGTIAGFESELYMDSERLTGRLSKGFFELVEKRILFFDENACFIAAKNFLKYNKPEPSMRC